jgi:hypothetical protein
MTEFYKQKCVLCDTLAEYCLADHDNRKYFSCPTCTEYQITIAAEEKLFSAPKEWRDKYAEKAKSLDENVVLVIRVPRGPRTEGLAYESVRGEPTYRSELPQCR